MFVNIGLYAKDNGTHWHHFFSKASKIQKHTLRASTIPLFLRVAVSLLRSMFSVRTGVCSCALPWLIAAAIVRPFCPPQIVFVLARSRLMGRNSRKETVLHIHILAKVFRHARLCVLVLKQSRMRFLHFAAISIRISETPLRLRHERFDIVTQILLRITSSPVLAFQWCAGQSLCTHRFCLGM
jgi:hypothetical protein